MCTWSNSQQLTVARADYQSSLPNILDPTSSYFSCSHSVPMFSFLPKEHLPPLWIKRSGQTAGNHTLAHTFVPAQGVSCIKNQSLSLTPFPAAWVSIHSTTPFSCQQLRVLSPHPTISIFLLCNSPWFYRLKHTQGLHSWCHVMSHPSRQRHSIKWALLRFIPQVKRNTNCIPCIFWFWESLKLWRTEGEAEQSSRSEHVSGSTESYLGHLTLEKPSSGSHYSCWISGSYV